MHLTTRIKKSKQMIRLVRPVELTTSDLIYPIFVRQDGKSFGIPSMKGQNYVSLEGSVKLCRKAVDLGIPAVMAYGVLQKKDSDGRVALAKGNFHAKIFKRLRKEFKDDLVLISNICLCDYTAEEYCVYTNERGKVLNEKTAEMLGKIAVVHAEAGADVIAPAAMCDGQVRHIRSALDEAGFEDVSVMTYVKTDSCLFEPYFEAMTVSETPRRSVDSTKFRTDIINEKMFMQKVDLDVGEGADMVIVKPALTNLDLIVKVKERHPSVPIAAYQVSGEYAMAKLLADNTPVQEETVFMETLNSIKRAGADMILTYYAVEAAKLLSKRE